MSFSKGTHRTAAPKRPGLFRAQLGGTGQSLTELFADLRRRPAAQLFAEDSRRMSQGARMIMDRSEGQGTWDFYRLDPDLFLVATDCWYDDARTEIVPGDELIEFHLRLGGRLELESDEGIRISVPQSSLLLWCQPRGTTFRERIEAGQRDTSVSLYFRPQALERRARQNAFELPEWIRMASVGSHFSYAIRPLTPRLTYMAKGLLQIPYQNGLRLLHAEAKSLELLCEIIHDLQSADPPNHAKDSELRRLDCARRIVTTQFNPVPKIAEIAHKVGMSESKLTRAFKERFGATLSSVSVDCRMRHALDLLRWTDLSVCQIAYAAGYRHHTTFTAAFREHFGFLPSAARRLSGGVPAEESQRPNP
jgi:AraC-like DNA-binding protein